MPEADEKVIEERKRIIKNWLKNPYNLALIAVILFAFAIRMYYFFATKGQTLWWDEAEYMATAKHWAFGVPYELNPQRPPLFQLLGTILLFIGFSEAMSKFVLAVIPSTFLVFAVYLLGNEMFGKKEGLLAALASAVLWTYLFWSVRFQPDFFSLNFQILALFFFWRLLKTNKTNNAVYAGIFAALGFYFKISALLVPLSMLIYAFFKDGLSVLRNKRYWIVLGSFVIAMVPFMMWQYINFGNPLAFAPSYIGGTGIGQGWAFGWMALSFFYSFPKGLFFILFLIGLGIALVKVTLSFDLMMKEKEKRLDGNIFSIIILLIVALFYIFYIRGMIEDRWVFLIAPFIFYFSSAGMLFIYEKVRKYTKIIAVIVLVAAFIFLIYSQISFTTVLVENKRTSYEQIKEAALWIRDNSEPSEASLSVSYTQTVYYSERPVYTYARLSEENFTKLLMEHKPKYMMASVLEPNHPEWIIQYVMAQEAQGIVMPYFNSSVITDSKGKSYVDVKQNIEKEKFNFTLVYPTKNINGVFIYKIDYN